MSASFILLLEGVVNRALRLDPDSLARLGELEGKVIRLQIAGAGNREIFVHPSAMGLRLSEQHDAAADVTLAGNIPVFMRFALRAAIPGVAATGEIQISGDIALGQRFQSVLEKIDIDWEEQAARVLGDVAAHHLGNAVRDLRGWSRQRLPR